MQHHFRPGWSEVEQKVLPVLREPPGLGGIHVLKQLAETLMQTNKGCVVTINASDGCQHYERQTVDGMLRTNPAALGPTAQLHCIVLLFLSGFSFFFFAARGAASCLD